MLHFVVGLTPWWPLAWLAPIPLLLAAYHASGRETRLLCIVAVGLGLAGNFTYYLKTTGPFAAVLLVVLQILAWGLLVQISRASVRRGNHWLAVFAYPVAWAGLDTLIAWFSPHGAWGSLAVTQADALPAIQVACLAGNPGIVFLVSLFASAAAMALYRGRQMTRPWLALGLPAAILLAALTFGAVRLAMPAAAPAMTVGLAAIDDFIDPPSPASRAEAVWQGYGDGVSRLARQGARVVVLPEKIATLDAPAAAATKARLSELARSNGMYVLAGLALLREGRKDNAAWLFDPAGRLLADYDKQQLVPHLEADITPGRKDAVCTLDGHRVGIVICRDLLFPRLARRYARRRASALLVPAWDFYRDRWLASRVAILRGVESGFSVIRCGRDGLLIAADPYGRIVAQAESASLPGANLLASVPLGSGEPTPYARCGDLFGWLCVALSVLGRLLIGRVDPVLNPT